MQTVSRADLSRRFAERRIILLKAEMKSRHIHRFAADHRPSGNLSPKAVENRALVSSIPPD